MCTIVIDTIAPSDQGSWYDIWSAAVALDGMCARFGQTGRSRFLGRLIISASGVLAADSS